MSSNFPEQEFLEFLVKTIVDHPEEVRVDRKLDERGILLTLHVQPEDMGQVVGRAGKTAEALRNLLRIVGRRNSVHLFLKIEEPEGGAAVGSAGSEDQKELPAEAEN